MNVIKRQYMKRTLLLFFCSFFLSLTAWSQARISMNEEVYDFGVIPRNKPVSRDFIITNTGNKPLVISEVSASCACTVSAWTKTPIAPGETGMVRSTFDAKMMGRFHKSLIIRSNAVEQVKFVALKGEVALGVINYKKDLPYQIGALRVDKRYIEFPPVSKGETPTAVIQVANTSEKAIELTLMHLPPYLKAEAKPGILTHGKKARITLTLDSRKLTDFGLTQAPIYLARYSGDKVSVDNAIDISAVLMPSFSGMTSQELESSSRIKLSSSDLDLGVIGPKDKVSQTIVITNIGKSKLEIKKLQVFNSAVNVGLRKKTIEPGQTTTLKVRLSGKWLKQTRGETKVLMITNDPTNPLLMINIKVKIKEGK